MSFIDKLKNMVNPVTQEPFSQEKEVEKIEEVKNEPVDNLEEAMEIANERAPLESPYEYEVLIKDNRIFEPGTWLPITTDRIKRPENIETYIRHGILRRINR